MQTFFSDLLSVKDIEVLLMLREQLKTELKILKNQQAKEECYMKILLLNQRIGKLYRDTYLNQKEKL